MNYSYHHYIKIIIVSLLLFVIISPALAAQKIKVVATLTLLQDFVKNIGGDRVEVRSLLSGLESEHTYTPKPSDIVAIKEARMVVKVGLGLEVWVDSLIKNASNNKLIVVTTSNDIPLLKNEETDYHYHDAHPGNPHIWLDPEKAKVMIRHITESLSSMDPEGSAIYAANEDKYISLIDAMSRKIEESLSRIANRKIITHHPAWPYFSQRFRLEVVDNIQTQVGTEPSARHIADIISRIKKENIHVIISEPQLNPKVPKAIADETGAKIIVLTPIPGGLSGTETYIKMMEYTGEHLAAALK